MTRTFTGTIGSTLAALLLSDNPAGSIATAPMVWSVMPHKGHVFFSDSNSALWANRIQPRPDHVAF